MKLTSSEFRKNNDILFSTPIKLDSIYKESLLEKLKSGNILGSILDPGTDNQFKDEIFISGKDFRMENDLGNVGAVWQKFRILPKDTSPDYWLESPPEVITRDDFKTDLEVKRWYNNGEQRDALDKNSKGLVAGDPRPMSTLIKDAGIISKDAKWAIDLKKQEFIIYEPKK
ncbi:MAG: hypothetical protein M1536_06725 [Firmicutes bacterium]|nr:hypothetical protein [Bacillota bacterium]